MEMMYNLKIVTKSFPDGEVIETLVEAYNITLVCAYNIIKLYSEYKGICVDLRRVDDEVCGNN